MKCYPLGVAGLLAVTCDCIGRGDLDGAQAALARARTLARDGRPARAALQASRTVHPTREVA
jgi:hypothetical protein